MKKKTAPTAPADLTPAQAFARSHFSALAEEGAGDAAWLSLAARYPEEAAALFSACAARAAHCVDSCNGAFESEEEETEDGERTASAVEAAAVALFGPGVSLHLNGDPRGYPAFISWPGMSERARFGWDRERGALIPYTLAELDGANAFTPSRYSRPE